MRIRKAVLGTLVLLAASFPVLAGKKSARPFFLEAPFTMNGAEIPQGMYQLTLESSNSSVQVTLWREGRFIAAAQGTWVKSGMKYAVNTVLLRINPDGTRSLVEIRLAGTSKTIVLNNSDATIQVSAK